MTNPANRLTGFGIGILGLAAALLLALAAAAEALPYKTGTYTAGDQHDGPGVRLAVRPHAFAVKRISYHERCSNGSDSFTDEFTFVSGSQASLTDRIDRRGHFSGKYQSGDGKITVTGNVAGRRATLTGTEVSTYTPAGASAPYTCRGTHEFHASWQG